MHVKFYIDILLWASLHSSVSVYSYVIHSRQEGLSGVQLLTRASVLSPLVTLPTEIRHAQASWACLACDWRFIFGCCLHPQPALLCRCYTSFTLAIILRGHMYCTRKTAGRCRGMAAWLLPPPCGDSHTVLQLGVTATLCLLSTQFLLLHSGEMQMPMTL